MMAKQRLEFVVLIPDHTIQFNKPPVDIAQNRTFRQGFKEYGTAAQKWFDVST